MNIFYISQYFPPEIGATQNRAYEMAHQWVKMGHSVTMVSEFPNHPSGVMKPEYRGKIIEKSNLDGIDVIRVWVKASPRKNFRSRMLFYLSFMFMAFFVGVIKLKKKYDFIYASSPPLFVGAVALSLGYLKRTPLVFEVRDLWPDSAIDMGELTNPRSITAAKKLEDLCYKKAKLIVVVTHSIYDKLLSNGVDKEKLILVPNGANLEITSNIQNDREKIRHEMSIDNKFVALYAGIHGIAQNLETIIETANILKSQHDIYFLLIGEGPKKQELMDLASAYKLDNLTFLPEIPRDIIGAYISASDIALIPLRKNKVFKTVIPSKLFDAWAAEKPVIVSIDGESHELVGKVNGGFYSPPEDPIALAKVLLRSKNNIDMLTQMGKNGHAYVQQYHSRQVLAKNLIQSIEKIFQND